MSEHERHTTRRTKGESRGVSATSGLGKVQRRLLVWLWREENRIAEQGTAKERQELKRRGVPFNQKRFLDAGEVSPARRAALSRALAGLESSPRRLVIRLGSGTRNQHTTHVRLTDAARVEAARLDRSGLMTAVQVDRRERVRGKPLSETLQIALRVDAALLDVLRSYLFVYRSRFPGESSDTFRRRHADVLARLDTKKDALVRLSAESPAAAFSAIANLVLAVRGLSELGFLTTVKLVPLDLEINADEAYAAAVAAELESADPQALRDLGWPIS